MQNKALISYLEEDDEMRERFINYAFKENPNIKNLNDFKEAFLNAWQTPQWKKGVSDNTSDQELLLLFESNQTKQRIKQNLTTKEYEELYGDGVLVRREIIKTPKRKLQKIITIRTPKIKVKSYKVKNRTFKAYTKGKPQPFTQKQIQFIKSRKLKKIKPMQIYNEYNNYFKEEPRTYSSIIKTKTYRI